MLRKKEKKKRKKKSSIIAKTTFTIHRSLMGLYRGSDVLVPRHGMQIIATRTFVMAAINLTAESLSSKYDKGLTIRKSQRVATSRIRKRSRIIVYPCNRNDLNQGINIIDNGSFFFDRFYVQRRIVEIFLSLC